jgi:predicted nucleotidyltransferase
MTIVSKLTTQKLIQPPKWLPANLQYLTIMGSEAYGVSSGGSDIDLYGWCIPPKKVVFPHLDGFIAGFGTSPEIFYQFQAHHIKSPDNAKEYDLTIFNVVKYFDLCMDNNPNVIDSLFVPEHCIVHSTEVAQNVRDRRKIFLHKGAWHRFKGYAYSQQKKIRSKEAPIGKRKELVDQFGYDVKFAYHVVRLMDEVQQILMDGDIDIQRNREELKSIRRGEWTLEQIDERFESMIKSLEPLYVSSKLPHSPDEAQIKQLLMDVLEHHYGSLSDAVVIPGGEKKALDDIQAILDRVRSSS